MPTPVESTESTAVTESEVQKLPMPEVKEETKQPEVPKTLKELEKDEPLLQENAHRFVLFPLKYHEIVCSTPPQHRFPILSHTHKTHEPDVANS